MLYKFIKYCFVSILLFAFTTESFGADRICGTSYFNKLVGFETYSADADKISQSNLQSILEQQSSNTVLDSICVPIIIHNVFSKPDYKVSRAAIENQLAAINEDFNRKNNDIDKLDESFKHLIGNVGIHFFLAEKDDSGNDFNGINYISTTVDTFKMENGANVKSEVYGATPWNPDKYINIWVCNLEAGISGYAAYPKSPANEDGIVIHYQNFGRNANSVLPPYHLGRTLTHELGHYFGLKHLYGETSSCIDDDGIADTPATSKVYSGCPAPGENLNHCNDLYSDKDLVQNFMNQCNDACIVMFTEEQKARILYNLFEFRKGLQNSNCHLSGNTEILDIAVEFNSTKNFICSNELDLEINLCNTGLNQINYFELELNNTIVQTDLPGDKFIQPGACLTYTLFERKTISSNDNFIVEVKNVNNSGLEKKFTNNRDTINFKVIESGGFPLEENFKNDPDWSASCSNEKMASWSFIDNAGFESSKENQNGCYTLNCSNDAALRIDHLYLPYIRLNKETSNNENEFRDFCIDFKYAYALNEDFRKGEGMILEYSLDCGKNGDFEVIWEKWGQDLKTTEQVGSQAFLPEQEDWNSVQKNISLLNNAESILLRFKFISERCNPVYIDDINVDYCENISLDIQNYINENAYGIFPNPSVDGFVNLYLTNPKNLPALVEVYNVEAKIVTSFSLLKYYQADFSRLKNGCYFINIHLDGHVYTKKLILSK